YLLASKAQLLARNLALETGNQADVRDCDYNLGITYFKIGNHSTALDFFTKAADGYKAAGMLSAYAGALDAIGNVYLKKKDYDAAERYYREAIDIAAPLESGSDLDPKYLNLGSVYFFRKDYAKAIEYTEKALKLANESGQIVVIADCYNNLGNCYRMTGNLTLAEVNSLQALEISKALARNETVMEALGNLVELNVQMGKADKALTYYRELESLKDSLHVDQAAAEVANLRIQFEAEQNAQAMLLLEEQKAAAVARAEKSSLWVWAAFSTAIAMFLALIIVASYQRNRKRQAVLELAQRNADFAHKKLELEQRALRAQMNPHFIFNSLNAIQRLYIEGDLDRAGDYMSDFAQLLRKILDHSSSATISLAAELETLALYLRLEEARLGGILEHEIVTDDDIDLYNTQLPPLVLQPFVENAIWHGILPARVQGKLQIALSPGEDQQGKPHLHCTIIDNGIGIDNARKAKANSLGHESKGIKITQERLGPGGEVHAEQLPQGGTKVTLIIPVNYE
ncbi:MAG TPA: tetratricopeptide repeat protein, partial [Bacteroidia bacterium]|nr:tetratricopeptide repeat protein [Bacteroidia bacterium]